jgi:hypothetical protein
MQRPRVESIYGPAKREIYKHMRAFNKRACGSDYRPLAITRREGDEIVGGLIGETYPFGAGSMSTRSGWRKACDARIWERP